MPNDDDPIILEPPPPTTGAGPTSLKVTIRPQGIQKFSTVFKQYSTWALAVILAAPELYQMAAMAGMLHDAAMPQHLMLAIRVVAGIGLVAKFIKQQKPA